jgi:hypothetical protein
MRQKYKISRHNPRLIVTDWGEDLLLFKGDYLADMYRLLEILNNTRL